MSFIPSISLGLAGLIHLLPLAGVLGVERLSRLYGINVADPTTAILLLHRAVLFGLLGALLIAAAFQPALKPWAFAAGLISTLSFLLIALVHQGYTPELQRVVVADVVAVVCLLIGLVAYVRPALVG